MSFRALPLVLFVLAIPGSGSAEGPVLPPPEPFGPEVHRARREALMKELGGGVAVLYARGAEDRDGFRQDSDFYYLTGLDERGAVLVLAPEERHYRHLLFLEPRDPEAERWVGERPPLGDSLRAATGFDRIRRTGSLPRQLLRLFERAEVLHAIHAPGGLEGPLPPEKELSGKLTARVPGVRVENAQRILPRMRSIKEPREIERMERAIEATIAAHRAAARAIASGVEENWVEALIELEFQRGGAVRPAFSSIVGSGPHSTILHYPDHDRTIAEDELVVVDIGAEYGRYAADITRTYPSNGRFSPEQRRIYELVLRAQEETIAMIRPGVHHEDLHRKAEEIFREAGVADAFLHGLGHFVGLDVHDRGLYGEPLRAGMVLTVEPGLYFADRDLGVRIEDEVLVTRRGARVLTEALPRSVEEIERLMAGE